MDRYDELRRHQTDGANYGHETEDIIARLKEWDAKYGIDISDVSRDSVTVAFKRLPEDAAPLAREIYEFCPDTVDQNFGCYEEMLDAAEETGEEIPPHVLELVEGIDFEDEHYGLELLRRSLKRDKAVVLWWD